MPKRQSNGCCPRTHTISMVSRAGYRLPARRGEHLACRFASNGGQDARLPHSQDGRAPLATELSKLDSF